MKLTGLSAYSSQPPIRNKLSLQVAPLDNQKGFTLIELLVSIVLLCLIAGPFLYIFVFSTKANITTEQVTTAAHLASQRMEYLYNLSASSATKTLENTKTYLVNDGYVLTYDESVNPDFYLFEKSFSNYREVIEITQKIYNGSLDQVIVKIIYNGDTAPTAKLEYTIGWD